MSLVVVVTRQGDRPDQLPETRVVPVGMPRGTKFGSYFAKRWTPIRVGMPMQRRTAPASPEPVTFHAAGYEGSGFECFDSFFGTSSPPEQRVHKNTNDDILLELAARIEADGAMPGKNAAARVLTTVITVLAFVSEGHTAKHGAFRSHVERMVQYLKFVGRPNFFQSAGKLSEHEKQLVEAILKLVKKETARAGDWVKLAQSSVHTWKDVEQSVTVAVSPHL